MVHSLFSTENKGHYIQESHDHHAWCKIAHTAPIFAQYIIDIYHNLYSINPQF